MTRNAAAETVRLAQNAFARGQQALAAGDLDDAARWLDRACRLAPSDHTLTIALGTACLARDPKRAAALFARVTAIEDVREAWIGLAAACLRLHDAAGAADALGQALRRHAPGPGLAAAADSVGHDVVRAAGAVGWCGLTGEGQVIVRAMTRGDVAVHLDGRPCDGSALPPGWESARRLVVECDGKPLIGSPIEIAAVRRCTGFVEAHAGGLRGWAWHPGDPESPVLLRLTVDGGASLAIEARDPVEGLQWGGALARPRGFAIPAEALAGLRGAVHVLGRDGRDLLGSPLDPKAEPAAMPAPPPRAARRRPGDFARKGQAGAEGAGELGQPAARVQRRPVDVVVPVHGGGERVLACLDSLLPTLPRGSDAIVVDDGSREPELAEALDRLAARGRIRLLRHPRALGFPAAANAGIQACPGHDVVLLNSDTLVPPGWLVRLREAALSAPDIGSATPLSNNATVLSYPGPAGSNPVPDLAATIALDAHAQRANPGVLVETPVGVGFCLYLRRDCIAQVGLLQAAIFAQGYGEENDFCLRARRLGWRHVAVPGVFVAHVGGASFGPAGNHLRQRNEELLNRLHPHYAGMVEAFCARDPLHEPRRRIDLERWRAARRRGQGAVLIVSHADGGGVERQIASAAEAHRAAGLRPVFLRPCRMPDGRRGVVLGDGPATGEYPNLRFALPEEMPALLRLLRAERVQMIEVHHLLNHPPAIFRLIARLGLPYQVHVHDYAWFCPRVALVGAERRYCGEPSVDRCEACVAAAGRVIDEEIGVRALRDRSARFLAAASHVVVPCGDVASRMRRHFPGLRPAVVPHEDDAALPAPRVEAPRGRIRICVLGAIGLHKGYDILLACARDAADRDLPLEFVVVGHTTDDGSLLATGRVFITGEYAPAEADGLIRAQRATFGLLPSIWPETWSLALTELWRAGLPVAAFDLGAPAERIRATGRGFVLPLGISASQLNNALVAAAGPRSMKAPARDSAAVSSTPGQPDRVRHPEPVRYRNV